MTQNNNKNTFNGIAENLKKPMSLTLDCELYQGYLDNSDLTEEQKQEFIETLWSIIVNFVDLGIGVHPLQQACEENSPIQDLLNNQLNDVLDFKNQ